MRLPSRLIACGAALGILTFGMAAPAFARPASLAEARVYGANLIRRLNDTGPNAWTAGMNLSEYFPDFNTLVETNGSLAGSHYGGPDYEGDAVCQCQDGGKRYTLTDVVQMPGGWGLRIRADASFANGARETQNYTIVVRRYRTSNLRVYDVVTNEGSTRAMLARHNACLRASHDAATIDRCFRNRR